MTKGKTTNCCFLGRFNPELAKDWFNVSNDWDVC